MFLGGVLGIVINIFDLLPSARIGDLLMPSAVDFVLLSFTSLVIIFSTFVKLGYQRLPEMANMVLVLVVVLAIVVMLNFIPTENAFIGELTAIIGQYSTRLDIENCKTSIETLRKSFRPSYLFFILLLACYFLRGR